MLPLVKRLIPRNARHRIRSGLTHFSAFVLRILPRNATRSYMGMTIHYRRGMSIMDRVQHGEAFEPELCDAITAVCGSDPSPILLDIGANLGLISLALVAKNPHITIHAFEPGPIQREQLEKTICTNRLEDRIHLYPVALSESAGTVSFYTHTGRDSAKDGLMDTERGEKATKITVETTTLDTWWEIHGKPRISVIKMDTEGAELLILRGAVEVLSTCRPTLFLEIEPSNLRAYPYTARDIITFLVDKNYEITTLDGKPCTVETIDTFTDTEDTFKATPRT